jgi:hypothetical protein
MVGGLDTRAGEVRSSAVGEALRRICLNAILRGLQVDCLLTLSCRIYMASGDENRCQSVLFTENLRFLDIYLQFYVPNEDRRN